jgi:hypothetical protein
MPSHKKNGKSGKRRRSQRKYQRGGDASNWATAVYGSAGAQTAVPNGGNLIAANNLSGVSMGGVASNALPIVGGSASVAPLKMAQGGFRKSGGKGPLMNVAVPAVLLYANQMIKRRKTMGKKYKKRFSRKFRKY